MGGSASPLPSRYAVMHLVFAPTLDDNVKSLNTKNDEAAGH
jgi:hypothetical protein